MYLGVKEATQKVYRLCKITQSKSFRLHVLESYIWRAAINGLAKKDRLWLFLYKTKLVKNLKLNCKGFYDQQSKNTASLRYDGEI